MGKRIELTEVEVQYLLDLYEKRTPIKTMVRLTGLGETVIYRVLREQGIKKRGHDMSIHGDLKQIVIGEYLSGKGVTEIGKKYGVKHTTVTEFLKRNNVTLRPLSDSYRKYYFNEHVFDKVDNQEKAYVLGMLWSDGHNARSTNHISIGLMEDDKQVLDNINLVFESEHPLRYNITKAKNTKNQYIVDLYSKYLSEQLEYYGMGSNKSLIKRFPEWLDESLYRHFIRGYFDGNGTVGKNPKKPRIGIVSSKFFCEQLIIIFNSKGYHPYLTNHTKTSMLRYFNLSRRDECRQFLDWIYDDATIYMKRKHDIYLDVYANK